MITLKEIRNRLKLPYDHSKEYRYINRDHWVYFSYYDKHKETSFESDIRSYIEQLPAQLQLWIYKHISMGELSGNIEHVTTDAILTYIDIGHYFYFGVFAL